MQRLRRESTPSECRLYEWVRGCRSAGRARRDGETRRRRRTCDHDFDFDFKFRILGRALQEQIDVPNHRQRASAFWERPRPLRSTYDECEFWAHDQEAASAEFAGNVLSSSSCHFSASRVGHCVKWNANGALCISYSSSSVSGSLAVSSCSSGLDIHS